MIILGGVSQQLASEREICMLRLIGPCFWEHLKCLCILYSLGMYNFQGGVMTLVEVVILG